jgi:hypothetical protein
MMEAVRTQKTILNFLKLGFNVKPMEVNQPL